MLTHPFFGGKNDKFFPNFVKNSDFIFAIFETKRIGRKMKFLHVAKVLNMFPVINFEI